MSREKVQYYNAGTYVCVYVTVLWVGAPVYNTSSCTLESGTAKTSHFCNNRGMQCVDVIALWWQRVGVMCARGLRPGWGGREGGAQWTLVGDQSGWTWAQGSIPEVKGAQLLRTVHGYVYIATVCSLSITLYGVIFLCERRDVWWDEKKIGR